jgi:hypothetical protein
MIDDQKAIDQGDRALTFREAKTLYGIPEHRMRQYRSQRALDFFKLGRAGLLDSGTDTIAEPSGRSITSFEVGSAHPVSVGKSRAGSMVAAPLVSKNTSH